MRKIQLSKEEKKVRAFLIKFAHTAKYNSPYIFYNKLCSQCNLGLDMQNDPSHRIIIGDILENISYYEHQNGRPILSSLVVTTSYEQGDGFYQLCEQLGMGEAGKLKRDRADFAMTKECIEYWNKEKNYKKIGNKHQQ